MDGLQFFLGLGHGQGSSYSATTASIINVNSRESFKSLVTIRKWLCKFLDKEDAPFFFIATIAGIRSTAVVHRVLMIMLTSITSPEKLIFDARAFACLLCASDVCLNWI